MSTRAPDSGTAGRSGLSIKEAGFTLVEVLLSLVLLSVLLMLLFAAFRSSAGLIEREQNRPQLSEDFVVQNLLRRLLNEATPIVITGDPRRVARRVFFIGRKDYVRFIAPMPAHFGFGGVSDIRLYLAGGEDGSQRLEMSWRVFRTDRLTIEGSDEDRHITLLDDIAEADFAYFGYRGKGSASAWYDEWQTVQALPQLIRLHLTFNRSDRSWPDLVAAPQAQTLTPLIGKPL